MYTENNRESTAVNEDSSVTSTRAEESWQYFMFSGFQKQRSYKDTMVLDSGSSIELFCNEEWLQDIKDLPDPHELNTNADGFKVKQEGELPYYDRVPLDREAMTNILSVGVMSDKYRISMDTAKENAFFVHTPKKIVKFARNPAYLYTHTPSRMPQGKATTA